ncbi:sulfide:quinone oxidoreductase [Holotrichia oblita]|uniref:Sulfide:quinone oxidoreductase n=1 Tax=Holotrichia oblita TaxID=644536 RepID=A0ACB9SMV6_HOLOL|nr:sulfide:quinone oxidoreductase [Holotrichia oblita]
MICNYRRCTSRNFKKLFSTTSVWKEKHCCKLLIIGGGTAGCNIAHRFSRILRPNDIIIVEPSEVHYYQPDFTFVGAGVKKLRDTLKATIQVLPDKAIWLKDEVTELCPHVNSAITKKGDIIEYEFMILAVGLELCIGKVKGLAEAFEESRNVCTIYSPKYVEKSFRCLKDFARGVAVFTCPKTPTKCFSASLKICFLAEDYFRRNDKVCEAHILFCTGLRRTIPVECYEEVILKVVKRKKIDLHIRTNLIEVQPDKNTAIFQCLDNPGETIKMEYNMLHVTPPMGSANVLRNCTELSNKYGYADVNPNTLQHKKYPNVFAIGDCTPGITNKTSSAIGVQSIIVYQNLLSVVRGKPPKMHYDGYTACPVVTGYGTCILAEFDYKNNACESLPWKQNSESRLNYYLKKDVLGKLYWKYSVKGRNTFNRSLLRMFKLRR